MMQIDSRRPHFRQPPIFEQAITVVFEPLAAFSTVDVGLFWSSLAEEFPDVEAAPRVATLVEAFEGVETPMRLTIVPQVQLPRTVMRNTAGEVIQFQEDRFTFNWVKTEHGDYPRFDQTLARFEALFRNFSNYLQSRGQSAPDVQQGELTNVNIVPVADFGADFSDMAQAFQIPSIDLQFEGLEPETFVRKRQHKMLMGGKPVGRLHLNLAPVYRTTDQEKAFQFEITARSAPGILEHCSLVEFFSYAHNMINVAFVRTVTPKMRKLWGEYDGE